MKSKVLRILGIETSCDETSCAVLEGPDVIKSNIVSSSLFRHKPFGGIVPEIASRHCLEQIDVVFQEALSEAKITAEDLDLIAVTEGPGLIGSLLVGVAFAKSLSYRLQIPLVGVNHLEAHLVANFISAKPRGGSVELCSGGQQEPEKFIGLLVSGGHTSLSYHEKGKAELLGSTVDDAVGEAYDKVAKILGLGFPGGPVIDKLAKEGNASAFRFTKPKLNNRFGRDSNNRGTPPRQNEGGQVGDAHRFDFSFSGIKTAVLHEVQKHTSLRGGQRSTKAGAVAPALNRNPLTVPPVGGTKQSQTRDCFASLAMTKSLSQTVIQDICASFQQAAVNWLVEKTIDSADFKGVGDIVVGGGVSANSHLRKRLADEGNIRGYRVWFPPLSLTGDNAVMIARRGLELFHKGRRASLKLSADPNLNMEFKMRQEAK